MKLVYNYTMAGNKIVRADTAQHVQEGGARIPHGMRQIFTIFTSMKAGCKKKSLLCIICFSVIKLTGKCSKCRLRTQNNTEFVCMDESKTTRVVHNYAALLPTSAMWVNFPNKFLSTFHFFVVFDR